MELCKDYKLWKKDFMKNHLNDELIKDFYPGNRMITLLEQLYNAHKLHTKSMVSKFGKNFGGHSK